MGEELSQLTRDQLACTIMAALISCPGRALDVDAAEEMCVEVPLLTLVMKQSKAALQINLR